MKKNSSCPRCGELLVEDAYEELTFSENGDMVIDAFLAWVCPKLCGYYEKI